MPRCPRPSRTFVCSSRIRPCIRSVGGFPTARCKSLALLDAPDRRFEQSVDLNRCHKASLLSLPAFAFLGPAFILIDHALDLRDLDDFLCGGRAVQYFQSAVDQAAISFRSPAPLCGFYSWPLVRRRGCAVRCSSPSFRKCRPARGSPYPNNYRNRAACRSFCPPSSAA